MDDYDLWINSSVNDCADDENAVDDIIANIDATKLITMFNMVIIEMYQLLQFSFSRFKTSLKHQQDDINKGK